MLRLELAESQSQSVSATQLGRFPALQYIFPGNPLTARF